MSERYHEEISQWFVCELNSDHKRVYSGSSGNAHLERAQKDGWYNHVTGCTWRSLCPDCVQECRVSLVNKGYLPVVIPMRYGAAFTKGLTEFIEGSVAPRGFDQQPSHDQTEELYERIRELTACNNDFHESTVILRGHIRELIEARNRRQWVRVADRLPDQSGFYLGIHDDIQSSVVRYKRNLDRWEFALPLGSGIVLPIGFEHPKVTHWQTLPSLPEEAGE